MSHQYELYKQIREVLASECLNDDHDVRELESGDIIVTVNQAIQAVTDGGHRILNVIQQFRCKNSGIVFRCILEMKAPAHTYKRVVNLITVINRYGSFSCFEFDYRDGEIASRSFLQCMDYIPSPQALHVMIHDTNYWFVQFGDQLIKAMDVDVNTLETRDPSEALNMLDEALKGNAEAQGLLIEVLKRDPDSSYYYRLREEADRGNGLAQALLSRLTAVYDSNESCSSTMPSVATDSERRRSHIRQRLDAFLNMFIYREEDG